MLGTNKTTRYGIRGARNVRGTDTLKDDLTIWAPASRAQKKTGFAYPVGIKNGFYFNKATEKALIKNNIHQFLLTKKGERLMLPTFGVNMEAYLFENLDDTAIAAISDDIISSFEEFFPFLDVRSVKINDLIYPPSISGGINSPEDFPQRRSHASRISQVHGDFEVLGDTLSNSITISVDVYYRDLDELFSVEAQI